MSLIACVPNISEGRRPDVVARLADVLRATSGVHVLDVSSDADHHRSVFTLAGTAGALQQGIVRLFEAAIHDIDLRTHRGVHPRMGAVDVVPFVPIGRTPMSACVDLARDTARQVAERFGVPVYLYERAAEHPGRTRLDAIRRGEFEGLAAKMQAPEWIPDRGPRHPHVSAGATAIGAREPLIAFNVNLATDRLDVARAIAATIRERDGGLPSVKALGLRLERRGIVQVSINLTRYRDTSLQAVYDAVVDGATRAGVDVLESEIVGLVPADALVPTAVRAMKLTTLAPGRLLDTALLDQL